jgi:hypothetical protein
MRRKKVKDKGNEIAIFAFILLPSAVAFVSLVLAMIVRN